MCFFLFDRVLAANAMWLEICVKLKWPLPIVQLRLTLPGGATGLADGDGTQRTTLLLVIDGENACLSILQCGNADSTFYK